MSNCRNECLRSIEITEANACVHYLNLPACILCMPEYVDILHVYMIWLLQHMGKKGADRQASRKRKDRKHHTDVNCCRSSTNSKLVQSVPPLPRPHRPVPSVPPVPTPRQPLRQPIETSPFLPIKIYTYLKIDILAPQGPYFRPSRRMTSRTGPRYYLLH